MRRALLLVSLAVVASCDRDRATTATPSSSSNVVITSPTISGATTTTTVSAGTTTVTTTSTTTDSAQPATTAASSVPVKDYAVAEDGATTVTVNGSRVRVDPDVPQRTGNVSVNVSGDNQTVLTLRGWAIVVSAGRVSVSGHDFGAVPEGAEVRIAKDGVYVAGEHRGALP